MPQSKPKALWKLTIDPGGKTDPEADSFEFCRTKGIVGVGWEFEVPPTAASEVKERYQEEYEGRYPSGLNAVAKRMDKGDHVWVRRNDTHYVCRVDSHSWYKDGGEWNRHDIHNVRDATWKRVPSFLVPGIIRRHLTQRGTGHCITEDPAWVAYSDDIFRTSLADAPQELDIDVHRIADHLQERPSRFVFQILDEYETEDVVGLYLQKEKGWHMIKSSTHKSQRSIECKFTRVKDGVRQIAAMQVKSGTSVSLSPADYANLAKDNWQVYLFSTAKNPYKGRDLDGVCCLDMDDIAHFTTNNLQLLPSATLLKMEFATDQ